MRYTSLITLALLSFTTLRCVSEEKGPDRKSAFARASISLKTEEPRVVSMTTSDQFVIVGSFYPSKQKAPTVLCLHQWRSDRSAYNGLAKTLQSAGFNVLTIDMRGYGDSQKKADGSSVAPDRDAVKDVRAAMDFLLTQSTVDAGRIGILGASYGSSNALIYAADDPRVKAVVALSPGLNYFNVLPTEPAVRKMDRRPILAIASKEDLRSIEAMNNFKEISSSTTAHVVENAGHGTEMLTSVAGIESIIVDFFKKNL